MVKASHIPCNYNPSSLKGESIDALASYLGSLDFAETGMDGAGAGAGVADINVLKKRLKRVQDQDQQDWETWLNKIDRSINSLDLTEIGKALKKAQQAVRAYEQQNPSKVPPTIEFLTSLQTPGQRQNPRRPTKFDDLRPSDEYKVTYDNEEFLLLEDPRLPYTISMGGDEYPWWTMPVDEARFRKLSAWTSWEWLKVETKWKKKDVHKNPKRFWFAWKNFKKWEDYDVYMKLKANVDELAGAFVAQTPYKQADQRDAVMTDLAATTAEENDVENQKRLRQEWKEYFVALAKFKSSTRYKAWADNERNWASVRSNWMSTKYLEIQADEELWDDLRQTYPQGLTTNEETDEYLRDVMQLNVPGPEPKPKNVATGEELKKPDEKLKAPLGEVVGTLSYSLPSKITTRKNYTKKTYLPWTERDLELWRQNRPTVDSFAAREPKKEMYAWQLPLPSGGYQRQVLKWETVPGQEQATFAPPANAVQREVTVTPAMRRQFNLEPGAKTKRLWQTVGAYKQTLFRTNDSPMLEWNFFYESLVYDQRRKKSKKAITLLRHINETLDNTFYRENGFLTYEDGAAMEFDEETGLPISQAELAARAQTIADAQQGQADMSPLGLAGQRASVLALSNGARAYFELVVMANELDRAVGRGVGGVGGGGGSGGGGGGGGGPQSMDANGMQGQRDGNNGNNENNENNTYSFIFGEPADEPPVLTPTGTLDDKNEEFKAEVRKRVDAFKLLNAGWSYDSETEKLWEEQAIKALETDWINQGRSWAAAAGPSGLSGPQLTIQQPGNANEDTPSGFESPRYDIQEELSNGGSPGPGSPRYLSYEDLPLDGEGASALTAQLQQQGQSGLPRNEGQDTSNT